MVARKKAKKASTKAKKKSDKVAVAKKSTKKKATRAAATATKAFKFPKTTKARTKSETMGLLADSTGLTKKQVAEVFEALEGLIGQDLAKGGPGMFTLPGLMKIVRVQKPATKSRKGVNPFTGEPMVFKAKPARNVVKVRPLKNLKEKV